MIATRPIAPSPLADGTAFLSCEGRDPARLEEYDHSQSSGDGEALINNESQAKSARVAALRRNIIRFPDWRSGPPTTPYLVQHEGDCVDDGFDLIGFERLAPFCAHALPQGVARALELRRCHVDPLMMITNGHGARQRV